MPDFQHYYVFVPTSSREQNKTEQSFFHLVHLSWGKVGRKDLEICPATSIQRRLVPDLLLKRLCSSPFTVRCIYNELPVIQLQQPCAGRQHHTTIPAQLLIFAFSSFPSFVREIYSKLISQSKILHTYLSAFRKKKSTFWKWAKILHSVRHNHA